MSKPLKENMGTLEMGKLEMGKLVVVNATWDPEASVWVAESDDLPLVTEAPTLDALKAKLRGMIQDLLEVEDGGQDIYVPFELVSRQYEQVRVRARHAA